jgi:hypothetical protein
MTARMNLYLVHCGFYDSEVFEGVYESHVNFFVTAENFEEARAKAKENPTFKGKRMHVDGLQEVQAVDGHRILLEKVPALENASRVIGHRHRDLASRKEVLGAGTS